MTYWRYHPAKHGSHAITIPDQTRNSVVQKKMAVTELSVPASEPLDLHFSWGGKVGSSLDRALIKSNRYVLNDQVMSYIFLQREVMRPLDH